MPAAPLSSTEARAVLLRALPADLIRPLGSLHWLGAGDEVGDTEAESAADSQPQVKRILPASMGMTLLLAPRTSVLEQ